MKATETVLWRATARSKSFFVPTPRNCTPRRAWRYPPDPHRKKSIVNKSIMKRSIYILTSAVCFALAAGSQVYANLVTNPGFEDPIGPEWTWHTVTGTVASHDRDTAIKYSGSYSYKIHTVAMPSRKATSSRSYPVCHRVLLTTSAVGCHVAFRPVDRNWAYIEAVGGGGTNQAPVKGGNGTATWEQWTGPRRPMTAGICTSGSTWTISAVQQAKNNSAYFDDIVVDGPGPVPTKLAFTSVPTTGVAGAPFNVTVQAQDASGNPASVTNTTTVTLSVGSGGGSLGGTTSGNIASNDTSVTISGVTYDPAGTMTLTATPTAGMTTITPVTSGNITFAAKLDWGSADAIWTAANVWRNPSTGTPATYNDAAHDYVVFEDTHSGTGDRTITLSSTVSPGNVSMTASKNFTISGSGAIAGTTELNKDGAGR